MEASAKHTEQPEAAKVLNHNTFAVPWPELKLETQTFDTYTGHMVICGVQLIC